MSLKRLDLLAVLKKEDSRYLTNTELSGSGRELVYVYLVELDLRVCSAELNKIGGNYLAGIRPFREEWRTTGPEELLILSLNSSSLFGSSY